MESKMEVGGQVRRVERSHVSGGRSPVEVGLVEGVLFGEEGEATGSDMRGIWLARVGVPELTANGPNVQVVSVFLEGHGAPTATTFPYSKY